MVLSRLRIGHTNLIQVYLMGVCDKPTNVQEMQCVHSSNTSWVECPIFLTTYNNSNMIILKNKNLMTSLPIN